MVMDGNSSWGGDDLAEYVGGNYGAVCKEIQPVHPKGDQPWVFTGRTDAEAETPVLRPPHAKS